MTSTADTIAELLLRVSTEGGEKIAAMGAQLGALDGQIKTLTLQETAAGTTITASAKAVESSGMTAEVAAKKLTGLGLAFGGAGVAVGLFSADMAAKFQASMELIHTQAGSSQAEVERLSSSILNLSTQTATGPEQLAASLYHVESAGFRSSAALDMVKAAAMGAKIGQADLETTTQAMVAAMASGISGIHGAQDAMAQLNAVVGTGDMRMQALALAMGTGILSAGANAGLSFRDIGAALATITDNATPADESATRLRMTIALMEAPSKKAQTALAGIGISSTQLALDLRQPNGLLVAVDDLKTHLDAYRTKLEASGMSIKQASAEAGAALTNAFGGGRSSSAIETLIGEFDRLKSKYGEQAALVGQFGDAWTKTQQTVSYDIDQLKADTERLAIEIGQGLLPQVDALAKAAIPLADGMAKVSAEHKTATATAFDLAAAIAAGSLAIRGFMALFGPYKTALATLGGGAFLSTIAELSPALLAAGLAIGVYTNKTQEAADKTGHLAEQDNALRVANLGLYPTMEKVADAHQKVADAAERHSHFEQQLHADVQSNFTMQENAFTGLVKESLGHDRASHSIQQHAKSVDELTDAYKNYSGDLSKLQGKENDALAVIAEKLSKHQQVSAAEIAIARQRKDAYDNLNGSMDRAKSLIDDNTAAISRMGAVLAGINTGVLSQASSITITAQQSPIPGASAATSGLEKALSDLPANLRSALDPEISKFGTEFSKTKSDYISSLEKEDGSLASGLKSLHDKFINDSKGADDKKLASLRTQYLDEVDKLKSGYLSHIAGLKDAFLKHVQDIEKAMSLVGSKPAQFDSLQSAIQTGLDAATKTVAIDLVTHSAALQKDTETLAYWTGQENSLKGKEADASLRGSKATNDFSAVLDSTRQKLQSTFDQASAKLVLDERNGNTGAIAGDRQRLDTAKANLDSFNTSVDQATGKVKQAKDAFASLESQLKDRATKALDTYLEALVKGGNSSRDMNDLWQKVIQTQKDDLSIAALRQRAEHDLALVTGDVTARMRDLADTLQASVDTDKAQAVSDLETYGKILPSHMAALKADSEALGKHAADVSKVDKLSSGFETPQTPSGRLGQEKSSADTAYQTALDQATLDLEHLGYVTQADRDALTEATRRKNELSQAEADATTITKAASATLTTFADVLKKITDRINTDRDTLALLVHNGNEHLNTPLPRTEQQALLANAAARPTETSPLITKTVTDLVKAYNDNKKAVADQTEADILAARKTHDWTQVITDSAQKIKTDTDQAMASLTHLLDSDVSHSIQSLSQLGQVAPVVAAQLQRSATEEEQQTIRDTQASRLHELAMIRAAQAAGDLAGAFDKQKSLDSSDLAQSFSALEEHFRTGTGDLTELEAAYQRNKTEVDLDTAALTQAYEVTGQYSDALKALTDGPTKDYENALAKVNIDLLTHSGDLQADIDAARKARAAKDAETQAAWDATFATSSLADQSKMLSQKFSELVSHQNTIDSAQSSVDSANIQIIAAQSTLAVDGINAEAKATEDLAGIIGKEDAVRSASASGQIAAITDQTKYISDSTAVLKATSPEALRVAQQQLLIDQVTAQEHRAEAAWQVRLASDALRTEQDKARGDQAASAAQIRVAGDALQVATDQRQLAVDQQQLTLDQLDVLTDIDSAIGGVNDYGDQIKSDLAALSADKQSISSDQTSLGNDTASANAIAAYNAQQAAMDSLLTAYDQSGSSSTSQDYQLQLAYLEQQKALYQVAVDQLSTQQQMASNLGAYSGQLQQMLFDFMGLLNLPAMRKNVVGMGTAQQMNGGGYAVQTITTVTPS